jgi:molybdopterin molybdotransferase
MPFRDLLGLRLAEPVVSQMDSPPFDKALVDGYAIATSDSSASFHELELVTAGGVPSKAVVPGATIRVMTGAPIPEGADAVMKWEDCEVLSDGAVRRPGRKTKTGECILKQGASFHAGQTVLEAGKRLGPLDIALLAEIGQAEAIAYPRPKVGVLPTGDELVEAHEPIGPGQIRNSNGPMLLAALAAAGLTAVDLGVGRDDPADLREKIARGLECDALLISGGVSAGVKDLVPSVLAELGVVEQFHQVSLKPGKPLWFGARELGGTGVPPVLHQSRGCNERPTGETPVAHGRTLVFGLPGNPVSTLVTFRLFVLPALRALAGEPYATPATERAPLSRKLEHHGNRPTYFPFRRIQESGKPLRVEPLNWKGSADLATLTQADCLAALPAGDYELAAGDEVDCLPL